MRNYFAKLVDKKVVPVETLIEIAPWFEKLENRVVKNTQVGDSKVSTVFLGINHGNLGPKDLWFETMVFGGQLDGETHRYETFEQAEAGHDTVCVSVRNRSFLITSLRSVKKELQRTKLWDSVVLIDQILGENK